MLSKVHMLLTMLTILGIPIMHLARSRTHRVQWSLMFLSLARVSLRLLSLAQVSLSLAQASLHATSLPGPGVSATSIPGPGISISGPGVSATSLPGPGVLPPHISGPGISHPSYVFPITDMQGSSTPPIASNVPSIVPSDADDTNMPAITEQPTRMKDLRSRRYKYMQIKTPGVRIHAA